tara:strand:- start:247 stop:519 length:273 start_codon:yes stop_codon:yes gene_type:complete
MFELEYHEIDRLMKIEHDMLFEGSHPGVTGGWDDRRHSVWKKGVYDIISILSKRKQRLDHMSKLYRLHFHSGQLLRLPTEVAMEILEFDM